jgi:hypothetical protein
MKTGLLITMVKKNYYIEEFVASSLEYDVYSKVENMHIMFSFLSDYKTTIKKEAIYKLMTEDFNLNSKWSTIYTLASEKQIIDENLKG